LKTGVVDWPVTVGPTSISISPELAGLFAFAPVEQVNFGNGRLTSPN